MTRTLLIILGILCALVTAAGVMWYNTPEKVYWRLRAKNPSVYYPLPLRIRMIKDAKSIPIPEIIKSLDDGNQHVRKWAVEVLGEINAKETIPEIKELLNDRDNIVRDAAERALKDLGVPEEEIEEAKKESAEQLAIPEVINFTGKVTSVSIYNRGPRSLADWLIMIDIKEADKADQNIQPGEKFGYFVHSPVQFFHEPGEKAVGKVYKFSVMRLHDEKGEITYSGLKTMEETLKYRLLLHDKDASLRSKAVRGLVHELDWESIPEIKKLLNDENEQVRQAAADALESFDRLKKHDQKAKENK